MWLKTNQNLWGYKVGLVLRLPPLAGRNLPSPASMRLMPGSLDPPIVGKTLSGSAPQAIQPEESTPPGSDDTRDNTGADATGEAP